MLPFVSLPNLSWQNSNLKFIDLTEDGHDRFVGAGFSGSDYMGDKAARQTSRV